MREPRPKTKAQFRFENENLPKFRGRAGCTNERVKSTTLAYDRHNNRFLYGMETKDDDKPTPVTQKELLEKVVNIKYNKEGLLFMKDLLGKSYSSIRKLSNQDASSIQNEKEERIRKHFERYGRAGLRKPNIRKKIDHQQQTRKAEQTPQVPMVLRESEPPELKKMFTEIKPTERWLAQKLKKAARKKKRAKRLQKKSQMPASQTKPSPSKTTALSTRSVSAQKKNLAPKRHAYIKVETSQRFNTLLTCLKAMQQDKMKVVIIVNYASSVKFYEELIQRLDNKSDVLFLSKRTPRNDAATTMETFETSQSATLFCTPSIAAKLKIKGPHFLIQFDPPLKVKRYISRLRKVGESKAGKTLVFLHPKEAEFAKELRSADIPIMEYVPHWVRPIDIQKRLDLLMKSFHVVYLSALNAYRDFLKSYKLMDSEFLKFSNISVKEVGRSFGFDVPPFVNLEEDAGEKKKREMDEKKERTKRRRNMKAEKVYVHIR